MSSDTRAAGPSLCRRLAKAVMLHASLTIGLLAVGCDVQETPSAEAPVAREAHDGHEHAHDHQHAHEHGAAVASELMISAEPDPPTAGTPSDLRMMIHRPDGTMVKSFDVVHEKKLHLILVRAGLDEFAHVHPEIDAGGNATVEHTFPSGGDYFVFADHQPTGEKPSVAHGKVHVEGEQPPAEKLTPNVPGKANGEALNADISVEKASSGGATKIEFALSDSDGEPVTDLEPYLGAMGHLTIVSADGSEYVHAHPEEGASAGEGRVAFQARFPKSGIYKGWGEFQRAGEVATIPFVMQVD